MAKAQSLASGERRYYLDHLRIILIMLVFLTHCALPFVAAAHWLIVNSEKSFAAEASIGFCYQWGLQLFFLVCGASAGLSLRRRDARQFVSERFFRLAVPYIAGVAILDPFQLYFEHSQRGLFHGSLPAFYGWFYHHATINWTLNINFGAFHLWFLRYLFEYSLIGLPFVFYFRRNRGQRLFARISRLLEGRGILLLIVPVAVVQMALHAHFHKHEGWSNYFCWLLFYLYGFFLSGNSRTEKAIVEHAPAALAIGLTTITTMILLFCFGSGLQWELRPTYTVGYLLYEILASVNTCAWVYCLLGFGIRFLNVAPRWLRPASAIVLPFYVLHHAVIVAVAYYIVQLNASILAKYLLISVPSLVITLLLCQFVVSPNPVFRAIFGMKKYHVRTYRYEPERAA